MLDTERVNSSEMRMPVNRKIMVNMAVCTARSSESPLARACIFATSSAVNVLILRCSVFCTTRKAA